MVSSSIQFSEYKKNNQRAISYLSLTQIELWPNPNDYIFLAWISQEKEPDLRLRCKSIG